MPKRHRTRRILLIVFAMLAALVGGSTAAAAVTLSRDNGPSPFSVAGGDGRVARDGDWRLASGQVGYRAKERALGVGHDVVGRTSKLAGSASVAGGQLRSGTVGVTLDDFTVSGRHHAESSALVHADEHPTATFTVRPGAAPGHVDGDLELNGVSRPVSWTIATRAAADGAVDITGTTRVDITQWGVTPPTMPGFAGIDRDVVLEFDTAWSVQRD